MAHIIPLIIKYVISSTILSFISYTFDSAINKDLNLTNNKKENKRLMGHIANLRKQFKSINTHG